MLGDQGSEVLTIPEHSNSEESRVIAENAHPNSTLDIDLNNVFNEMEAQSTNPVLPVTLIPQEIPLPAGSDESTNIYHGQDGISRPLVEEPTITRTSKTDILDALDETLQAFAAEDAKVCDNENIDAVSEQKGNAVFISGDILDETKLSCHVDSSQQVNISVTEKMQIAKKSNNEYNSRHGESFATTLTIEGSSDILESAEQSSEEISSSSSQVTVENIRQDDTNHEFSNMKPLSPSPIPENPPAFHSSSQNDSPPSHDKQPPGCEASFPNSDMPPPLPNTLPPTLPVVSPPSVMHSDLDDDIEAILAGELYEDTGDLTPSEEENPVKVRPTLEQEIQSILGSEDSSVRSEANTVLSMDSLNKNQTTAARNTKPVSLTVSNSVNHENTNVFNNETEMMSSFDGDDVISDDVSCTDNDVISEAYDDAIFQASDRLLYAGGNDYTLETHLKSDRKSRRTDDSQEIMETKSSPSKRVVFQNDASEDSTTESSSVCEGVHRGPPPPVLPKPKYRSHSMNLPISELPHLPRQRLNSMAAQKDIVDGYFPPVGLVTKRASEFNLGECDLLKERIIYLERQLKVRNYLSQCFF